MDLNSKSKIKSMQNCNPRWLKGLIVKLASSLLFEAFCEFAFDVKTETVIIVLNHNLSSIVPDFWFGLNYDYDCFSFSFYFFFLLLLLLLLKDHLFYIYNDFCLWINTELDVL